jgi:mannosyltransferase
MTDLDLNRPPTAQSALRTHTLVARHVHWLPPIIAGALGLYQLGNPSLWIDEATTVENATGSWWALRDELHWLYYVTVKPWFALAGTSEIVIRLPSVVGAIAAVVLLYGLARMLFGERVALVSSLLLAINPLMVQWSQQARGYTVLVAVVIGVTWLFLRALERDTTRDWAVYGVALAVLVLWQTFSALIFLPAHVVVARRKPRAIFTWYVVAVALIPWLWVFVSRPPSELPTAWIPELTPQYAALTSLEVSGAMGVGLALALVGLRFVQTHRRLLVAWAFLPFALAGIASVLDGVFLSRYLIVCTPAFALLGGVGIVGLVGKMRVLAVTATAAATVLGLVVWYSPDGSTNWQGEDWKAATEFVMRHGGAEIGTPESEHAYLYYGGRIAKTGWVVERRPWGGFSERPDVYAHFGWRLRVLRLESSARPLSRRSDQSDGPRERTP